MAYSFVQSGSPSLEWQCIASSSDGVKLVAGGNNTQIYTSTDSGQSWTARDSARNWVAVSSSSDGVSLFAVVYNGYRYISLDSGVTWEQKGFAPSVWTGCASSADGLKIAACTYDGLVVVSLDGGGSFDSYVPGEVNLTDINISDDGLKIAVASLDGFVCVSSDSGQNWTVTDMPGGSSIASSANGNKIFSGGGGYALPSFSTNGGATWAHLSAISGFRDCKISSTGELFVIDSGSFLHFSSDNGVTWEVNDTNAGGFPYFNISDDGSIIAVTGANTPIYIGSISNYNIIQETISFVAAIAFNANTTCAYHETISFGAAIDFNADRGVGTQLGIAYGTENGAITTFSNMPYEFSCNFKGKTLFASEFGLFEYGGTTDNGTPVVARIKTDKSNKIMGQGGLYPTQHRKHLPTSKAYLNVEASDTLNLNVTVDGDTYAYTDATIKTGMAVHPIKVGRGLDGVHWQLEVENFETLESIEFEPVEIRRRGK